MRVCAYDEGAADDMQSRNEKFKCERVSRAVCGLHDLEHDNCGLEFFVVTDHEHFIEFPPRVPAQMSHASFQYLNRLWSPD